MNLYHQLALEVMSQGYSIPVDVARQLIDAGYNLDHFQDSIDGFDVIDPTEVDYFDYIDQNH